jgi:phosphoribosylamine---glycine ligase
VRILVVGNGAREHALLWKLARDAPAARLFVTRGNGGTGALATHVPVDPEDVPGTVDWAAANRPDLVVVGPEVPLAAGIVDRLRERGLHAFGPSRAAARIESSKVFAKELMRRHGVPTAAFRAFTELAPAETYVRALDRPVVVKASGLAAGKGVVMCGDAGAAVDALRAMMAGGAFGAAGAEVVVEEWMRGEELSLFALCDGERVLPMLAAQDHKRIGEGETGPNTGGMGACAPVSITTPRLLETVERTILRPTVAAMAAEGHPFTGLLYAGLMLTDSGPSVVEFNARFGDPEAQVVLPLLRSSLLEPMLAVARGERLPPPPLAWDAGAAVTTVLASGGYPGSYRTGHAIEIPRELDGREDLIVFHAGTRRDADGVLRTAGGRVLSVTALAASVPAAAAASREAAGRIAFEGRTFRRDIGWREFARSAQGA